MRDRLTSCTCCRHRVEPDQLGRPLPDAIKAALTKTFVGGFLRRRSCRLVRTLLADYQAARMLEHVHSHDAVVEIRNSTHSHMVRIDAGVRSPTDKVVPDVGLVITVYDIVDISGGFIYPSDGAAIFDVLFRLVVFVPFVGEVIVGRLIRSSRWVDAWVPAAGWLWRLRLRACLRCACRRQGC